MVLPEALSIVLLRKHNAENNWHMQLLAYAYAVVGLPVILFLLIADFALHIGRQLQDFNCTMDLSIVPGTKLPQCNIQFPSKSLLSAC